MVKGVIKREEGGERCEKEGGGERCDRKGRRGWEAW